MRIKDWRTVVLFLIFCGVVQVCFAGSTKTTVLIPQKDPQVRREFDHVYQTMANAPSIFIGSGVPAFTPQKVGDTFIDTTTAHVYASTATVTKGSWLMVK